MNDITTIGLDTAKSVFQIHGIDADHQPVLRRQLKRRQVLPFFTKLPPCLIGIEACSASHHWSRELINLGHTVRLIPPRYVKPYVKSQKNDATDAEAICEAVTRPSMRFVPTKTREQQAMLMLHRTRHLLIRQRTATINALRAHMVEFGIAAGIGRNGVEALLKVIADGNDDRVPDVARDCLMVLGAQLDTIKVHVRELDAKIMAAHRASELSQRLEAIPGVGPRIATALVASIVDPTAFKSGRQMAAWIGSKTELIRWKREARRCDQGGRSLSTLHAYDWCIVGDQAGQATRLHKASVAGGSDGTPTGQGCSDCIRQQDHSYGLGHDGAWGTLP